MLKSIIHVLPGESGGDVTWFDRQNEFEQKEILRQVEFKARHWPDLGNGRLANRPEHEYPHILPQGQIDKAFYKPIAEPILSYFDEENISIHTEALNLKSSQVACLNFLFPLRLDPSLATSIFQRFITGLDRVLNIEFEYTGPIEATRWLGEPLGGKRGQNRTSIDAAIFWLDATEQEHVSLIEWKYTERNYGVCSAYSGSHGEVKERCKALNVRTDSDPAASCQLTSGKRHRNRRYWEHLGGAGIDLQVFSDAGGCPFQGPLYQLMRQYLLGIFLKESGEVLDFEIISMGFSQNVALKVIPGYLKTLQTDADDDILGVWNRSLPADHKVRHINIEELTSAIDEVENIETKWRNYLFERYGV